MLLLTVGQVRTRGRKGGTRSQYFGARGHNQSVVGLTSIATLSTFSSLLSTSALPSFLAYPRTFGGPSLNLLLIRPMNKNMINILRSELWDLNLSHHNRILRCMTRDPTPSTWVRFRTISRYVPLMVKNSSDRLLI